MPQLVQFQKPGNCRKHEKRRSKFPRRLPGPDQYSKEIPIGEGRAFLPCVSEELSHLSPQLFFLKVVDKLANILNDRGFSILYEVRTRLQILRGGMTGHNDFFLVFESEFSTRELWLKRYLIELDDLSSNHGILESTESLIEWEICPDRSWARGLRERSCLWHLLFISYLS